MKKKFTALLLALILLGLPVLAVSADAGVPAAQTVDITQVIALVFTDAIVKQLLTLLGLILLQVILAVALALKQGLFEWKKLADFYKTLVLPYVLGWLAFIVAARLISIDLLPAEYQVFVSDGITWATWLIVISSMGAKILATVKELYGAFTPFPVDTTPQP